ncbi:MAG: hypothetical protein DRQ51_02985 [Gammaproteobacteria bacterium]|nr:MAG: hypothetical protein DRQ51_02985 [Gammaproteobacteria bacterium]
MQTIFTVGHSVLTIIEFVEILDKNNIDTIVDVRSVPYSKYNPQFNQEVIKQELLKSKIQYLFMGHMLGARYDDLSLLDEDKIVDFKKVQQTKKFQKR